MADTIEKLKARRADLERRKQESIDEFDDKLARLDAQIAALGEPAEDD